MMIRTALALAVLAAPAAAQEIRDCDTWEANARNLISPVTESVRTFANGDIRVIGLDTAEPAFGWGHILVQFPSPDDPFPQCRLISAAGGSGFAGLDMAGIDAAYDPASGLTVTVPIARFDGNGAVPGQISFTINQATGTLTLGAPTGPAPAPTK